jgi:hypothetical protein
MFRKPKAAMGFGARNIVAHTGTSADFALAIFGLPFSAMLIFISVIGLCSAAEGRASSE